jgi:hypothetical protein
MKHNWMNGAPLGEEHRRDLLESRTFGDLAGVLKRHGWEPTGRGKGGHQVYVNDNVIGIITLPSQCKKSDRLPPYMYREFKEFCQKAPALEMEAAVAAAPRGQSLRHHK